jgi:hypothetical protein
VLYCTVSLREQVFATVSNFKRLPLSDRATMAGLLYAMLDFGRDEQTFAAYDRMTAHELFLRMGMSKRLVSEHCCCCLHCKQHC